MKALKLSAQQLASLRNQPKLNQFWSGYFQNITIEFNRLFFSIFREPVTLKVVSCQTYAFDDYLEQSPKELIMQFFKIHPHNSFGFYSLPYETVDLLLTKLMGGHLAHGSYQRDLSHVDQSILEIVTSKLMDVLEAPFVNGDREIFFEHLDLDEKLLTNSLMNQKQNICVQKYLLQVDDYYYELDLAFTNKFLDRFIII